MHQQLTTNIISFHLLNLKIKEYYFKLLNCIQSYNWNNVKAFKHNIGLFI